MKTTNAVAAAIGIIGSLFIQGTSAWNVLGRSPSNFQCYAGQLLSNDCSTSNQGVQCTVYIPSRGEFGTAYLGPNTECVSLLRRPL